jgi:hypothetical protein
MRWILFHMIRETAAPESQSFALGCAGPSDHRGGPGPDGSDVLFPMSTDRPVREIS